MDLRKSAVDLSPEERDRFLRALFKLKHRPAPNHSTLSLYDQFVALHGAVMAVRAPGAAEPVNFGHWMIGFCAWHREYIRRYELALQAEEPGVTLPYWDWSAHEPAMSRLFTDDFMGPLFEGPEPRPITTGVLAWSAPEPRPSWWPDEAEGWRIHERLREIPPSDNSPDSERRSATLHRGRLRDPQGLPVGWPPTAASFEQLVRIDSPSADSHPFWYFWRALEAGWRTHNTCHNFIGGHMSGAFSPNDPIFWLHHANVDRAWERWQQNRLAQAPGTSREDHYPAANTPNPWNGRPAPMGHYLDDLMWPWVGDAQGYATMAESVADLLPATRDEPARRVRDVLDPQTLGYAYQEPEIR
jgi:tyrosinase